MRKATTFIFALVCIAASVCDAAAFTLKNKNAARGGTENQSAERTQATDPAVIVTMCVASGNVTVRGWNRREVRAASANAADILLQHSTEKSASSPATRLEVTVIDSINGGRGRASNSCSAYSDVVLDVPRGASLELKTVSGDIRLEDVAEARVQTVSGTLRARRIGKGIEAISVSGNMYLEDSSGAARLRSVSGAIEARGLTASATGDDLDINSTSGSISLERIGQTRVEVSTVSGRINMAGALARGGRYRFKTLSGNIDLLLQHDASFQFNARVSRGGDILFDNLPFNFTSDDSRSASRSVNGFFGAGDATLTLSSFSGTLRLRRQ